jgi:hypothetical protein
MEEDIYFIKDLPTLQVISDPLRLSIFKQINETNQEGGLSSAKQLSEKLQIPQTKLYYHLKMMEQHHFIEVAETRLISGIQEKLYRVCASRIMVAEPLLSGASIGRKSLLTFASGLFSTSLEEMQNSMCASADAETPAVLGILRKSARLSTQQAQEFNQRLEKMVEEFTALESLQNGEELKTYVLLLTLYPLAEGQNVKTDNDPTLRIETKGEQ